MSLCLPPGSTAEVSSIELDASGLLLLASYRDNSNRLWDLRTTRCLSQRFKGHRNVNRHFIRSCFGPSSSVICGGSEDGVVYLWAKSGSLVGQLRGHAPGLSVSDLCWSPR
eukprot:RCo010971